MAIPVFLDCDPGHDDMMAIMLAVAHPEIELLGISTVAGNQTGDRTWHNAATTLTLIDATEVPLIRGADQPLCRPLVTAADIHGTSGLDGADLPPLHPRYQTDGDGREVGRNGYGVSAATAMAERIIAHGSPVTLVPTGPLTNVALALRSVPALKAHIREIVIMGGGVHDSNVTPAAEFNIYVDPEAAAAVFASGIPIRLVTVDVTNRALITYEQIETLSRSRGEIARIVSGLMRFFADANNSRFGIRGAPIHDALTIAAVIDPSVVTTRPCNVVVETQGEYTRGCTVVDVYGVTGRPVNAEVTFDLDHEAFIAMMLDAIRVLDERRDHARAGD